MRWVKYGVTFVGAFLFFNTGFLFTVGAVHPEGSMVIKEEVELQGIGIDLKGGQLESAALSLQAGEIIKLTYKNEGSDTFKVNVLCKREGEKEIPFLYSVVKIKRKH